MKRLTNGSLSARRDNEVSAGAVERRSGEEGGVAVELQCAGFQRDRSVGAELRRAGAAAAGEAGL